MTEPALAREEPSTSGELSPSPPVPLAARPIAELVTSGDQASPELPVAALVEVFRARPEVDAVALVSAGRPVGLVTRQALLLRLGRNFGYELFARRPASRVADPAPLVVGGSLSLSAAVERAFARPPASAYDDLVVVDEEGLFLGLLSARRLAVEQGLALARSLMEQETTQARNRELQKVEAVRAQFLAHATHELRSPVNAIVGLSEILGRACARGDLEGVRERVELLRRTATGLRGTVNDILDLSKMEAGRMTVHLAPVEVGPLLAELCGVTRLLLGNRPIDVVLDDGGAPATLRTDRQRLQQILTNLLSNAAKFTEAGTIVLGAAAEPDGACFWVQDSGCGIKPEDLERLFRPFGQLEDARTKSHAGTGLGLVISQSLARLLGGRIAVESRRGEGSRFTLHLSTGTPPEEHAT
jgi:signal transduction histidine kinase